MFKLNPQFFVSLIFIILLSSCFPLDSGGPYGSNYPNYPNSSDPYYPDPRDPYYDPYGRRQPNSYGNRPYDTRYDYEHRERQIEEIRREKDELRRERERQEELDRLREQRRNEAAKKSSTCPSGFWPRSSLCSSKERKRGCKDTRAPNGQGCVGGRF